jgi:hypothetical protein
MILQYAWNTIKLGGYECYVIVSNDDELTFHRRCHKIQKMSSYGFAQK